MSKWAITAGAGLLVGAAVYWYAKKRGAENYEESEEAWGGELLPPSYAAPSSSNDAGYTAPSAAELPPDYEQKPYSGGGASYEPAISTSNSGTSTQKPSTHTPTQDSVDFGGPREIPTEEQATSKEKTSVSTVDSLFSAVKPAMRPVKPVAAKPSKIGPTGPAPRAPAQTQMPVSAQPRVSAPPVTAATISAPTMTAPTTPKTSMFAATVQAPKKIVEAKQVQAAPVSVPSSEIGAPTSSPVPVQRMAVQPATLKKIQAAPVKTQPLMKMSLAKGISTPLKGVYAIGADLTEAQYRALSARAAVEAKRREWAANQLADRITLSRTGN